MTIKNLGSLGQIISSKNPYKNNGPTFYGIVIGRNTDCNNLICLRLTTLNVYSNYPEVKVADKTFHIEYNPVEVWPKNVKSIEGCLSREEYMRIIRGYIFTIMGYQRYNSDTQKFEIIESQFDQVTAMLYGFGIQNTSNCEFNYSRIERKADEEKQDETKEISSDDQGTDSKTDSKVVKRPKKTINHTIKTHNKPVEEEDNSESVEKCNIKIHSETKLVVNSLFKTFIKYAKGNSLPLNCLYNHFCLGKDVNFDSRNIKYTSRNDIEIIIDSTDDVIISLGIFNSRVVVMRYKTCINSLINYTEGNTDIAKKTRSTNKIKNNPFKNPDLCEFMLEEYNSSMPYTKIFDDVKTLDPDIDMSYSSFKNRLKNYVATTTGNNTINYSARSEFYDYIERMQSNYHFRNYPGTGTAIASIKKINANNMIPEYISGTRVFNSDDKLWKFVFYYILYAREKGTNWVRVITRHDDIAEWFNTHTIKEIYDALGIVSHRQDVSTDHTIIFCKIWSHYRFAKNSEINSIKHNSDHPKELSKVLYPLLFIYANRIKPSKECKKEIENIIGVPYQTINRGIVNMSALPGLTYMDKIGGII